MTKATGQRISAVQASHQQPLVIFLSYFSTNPTHLFGESVDHSWPSSVFFLFFDDDWWCFHFFSASFVHLVSFGQIHSSFHIFSHHMFGFSEAGREACELYLKWEPANSLGSCFERLLCLWKDLGTGHEKGVDSDWLLFWVMFVSGLLICLMQRQMVGWTLRLAWIDGLMDPGSRLAPWCSSRPSAPETTDMLQARQEVEAELRARQVHLGQDVTWGECTV